MPLLLLLLLLLLLALVLLMALLLELLLLPLCVAWLTPKSCSIPGLATFDTPKSFAGSNMPSSPSKELLRRGWCC